RVLRCRGPGDRGRGRSHRATADAVPPASPRQGERPHQPISSAPRRERRSRPPMLSRLRNMFRVPDLRNKILFTLVIVGLYRVGAHLPVPFIDFNAIKDLQRQSQNTGVVGFLDLFSGGAITNVAVFFLGIMPYITASIIMQLLGVVIPKLEEWQNEGQTGQKKITQWTRYLTVALALVQSTGFVFALKSGNAGLFGLGSNRLPQGVDFIPNFSAWRAVLIVL